MNQLNVEFSAYMCDAFICFILALLILHMEECYNINVQNMSWGRSVTDREKYMNEVFHSYTVSGLSWRVCMHINQLYQVVSGNAGSKK